MLSRHRGLDATGRAAPRLREDLSAALAAGITLIDEHANKISTDIHRTRTVCELRHNGALKFSVEVGLLPELFLDACLRRAHAMDGVHRRADFVGGRR